MDSKLISEIPLGDGTAYGLTRLVAGATFERSYALQRPMDNDNLRGVTVSGTISSEFTLDGSSNVGSQARVAIQPPADAIQEFKVETAVYDAQVGHTGAGTVNLALKSGTNELPRRGLVLQPRRLALREPVRLQRAAARRSTPRDYNRFSATLSRPHHQEQDVLPAVLREAAGRHHRDRHRRGAHGAHAQRRLLGAAGRWAS